MAVSIRLQRKGSTHRPFYHLVATDSRNARDGRFIEKLGHYDPTRHPSVVEVNADRVQYWFSKGAQLSDAVKSLVKVQKISLTRTSISA
jgi:small subunit ribosomal protein S16